MSPRSALLEIRNHPRRLSAIIPVEVDETGARDESGLEADAIIETADGRWAAFEVKLGHGEIDAAASHLRKLRDRIDTSAIGEPLALGVITGTGYGYVRADGVAVIPIGALAP